MDNTIPWIITFPVTGSHNQTDELWGKYGLIIGKSRILNIQPYSI
jgi:hypothetical protein